jgi:hypothetical protein
MVFPTFLLRKNWVALSLVGAISLIGYGESSERGKRFLEVVHSGNDLKEKRFYRMDQLFDFAWEKACFDSGPEVSIKFHEEGSNLIDHLEFDADVIMIRESYVPGSPSGICLGRDQQVGLEEISVRYSPVILLTMKDDRE